MTTTIEQLTQLVDAATPGPWYVVDTDASRELFNDCPVIVSAHVDDAIIATIGEDVAASEANALLIALARDGIKDLLSENQRMRELLETVARRRIIFARHVPKELTSAISEIESFLAEHP